MELELELTHPDEVEGRLATEDWFPPGEERDERMDLVQRVFGSCWQVDRGQRVLHFMDPYAYHGGGSSVSPLAARALSFPDNPAGAAQDPRHLNLGGEDAGYLSTYGLKTEPSVGTRRVFSSFRLSLPAQQAVFARVSVYVRGEAYDRLIASKKGRFAVVGPAQTLRELETEVLRSGTSSVGPYADALTRVKRALIKPARYHILIGQPALENAEDQLVRVRPTSSSIRELYIPDVDARERAFWFESPSADFQLHLEYVPRSDTPRRARQYFYKRLSPFGG